MRIVFTEQTELSNNFKLKECVRSSTASKYGINNTPLPEQLVVIIHMLFEVVQPIRDNFGPLRINSFFRSKTLNKKIGGARKSDHQILEPYTDCAVDIDDNYLKKHNIYNRDIVKWLLNNPEIPIYKLIWEFSEETPQGELSPKWIHISFSTNPEKRNVRYFYEAYRNKEGKVKYKTFDRQKFGI